MESSSDTKEGGNLNCDFSPSHIGFSSETTDFLDNFMKEFMNTIKVSDHFETGKLIKLIDEYIHFIPLYEYPPSIQHLVKLVKRGDMTIDRVFFDIVMAVFMNEKLTSELEVMRNKYTPLFVESFREKWRANPQEGNEFIIEWNDFWNKLRIHPFYSTIIKDVENPFDKLLSSYPLS